MHKRMDYAKYAQKTRDFYYDFPFTVNFVLNV